MNAFMKIMKTAAAATILVGLVAGTPRAWSQENATITGTALDPASSVVPNAAITLTNDGTTRQWSTKSNSSGTYTFTALQVGHYSLSASAQGFVGFTQRGIVLNVGDTVKIDIHFKIGSANQSVTVQANALNVQAETNEISSLISGKQITQLEINGRNVMSLTTLGMGVTNKLPDFNTITGLGGNDDISFEGARPEHNLWMIDGAEETDWGAPGRFEFNPSPDALAEFKVLSSNYSPEYGLGSGGTTTMVLKSGTSHFHGGLWEFNRNDAFDANSYIAKQTNQPKPELRLNIFGGNLGGPLWIPHIYNNSRNRTFFFVNEEWRRQVEGGNPSVHQDIAASNFPVAGQSLVYTPPTNGTTPVVPASSDPARLALYTLDGLTQGEPFPNNTIPSNLIDQNAVLFMGTGAIPKPNAPNNNYVTQVAYPTNVYEDIVRIDHKINDKFQLMGHFMDEPATIYQNSPVAAGSSGLANTFPTPEIAHTFHTYSVFVKLQQAYTPSLLNETSFNFNRDAVSYAFTPNAIYQEPAGWNASGIFSGNNPDNKLPGISIAVPYTVAYDPNFAPYHSAGQIYQPSDNIYWTKGRHNMSFGGSYMRYAKLQQIQTGAQGTYTFTNAAFSGDSYVNFLLGLATAYSQLQQQSTGYYVTNSFSFYANDNWHVNTRLTLNVGLRYDAFPHTFQRFNKLSNFDPESYNPADAPEFTSAGAMNPDGPGFSPFPGSPVPLYLNGVQVAGINGVPRGLVKNYWGNVEPRVGFAYDLFGDGKTILRGGAGIFYQMLEEADVTNLAANPPYAYQASVSSVYFSNPSTSAINGHTAAQPTFPATFTTLAQQLPSPGTLEFSLGVQRRLTNSIVGEIQYVGNTSWHQWDDRAINTLPLSSALSLREAVSKATGNANLYRTYPGFSGITQTEMASNSSYHSLQAGLRTENWHGATLQLAYTYSHVIDIVSDDDTDVSDPFNLNYDRGSGTFDIRHILNANLIYHLPFFLHSGHRFERQALGGWQFSGIMVAQTGFPLTPSYPPDVIGLGGGTSNRPNVTGTTAGPKTEAEYFNTKAFSAPVAPWNGGNNQGFGSAGKGVIVGPGRLNFNLALLKTFPLTSHNGPAFQFRFESFNTFNHTQFDAVNTNFKAATFGQVTSTYDPRVIQLGGKFLF